MMKTVAWWVLEQVAEDKDMMNRLPQGNQKGKSDMCSKKYHSLSLCFNLQAGFKTRRPEQIILVDEGKILLFHQS